MIARLVDIRAGEWTRALLAFASLLLVIAAYTMVKAVRDALFLSKFGVTELSLMAMGLALATGFVVSLYLRLTARLPRNWLTGGTNLVIVTSMALIWLGLRLPALSSILPWVLYIWSSVFGVFIVMQFWMLANVLFDPREGKRLFGFIGGGAILGGIIGGFLSRALAPALGTANLLLVAGALLLVEAGLVFAVWPHRKQGPAPRAASRQLQPSPAGGLSALQQSRMVRLLATALLFSTIATTLLDWQFKGIAKAAFAGRTDEMAAFFGSLYGTLSVASFLVQTLLTGLVLRRFGVGVGLMALPVSMLAGAVLIISSALFSGVGRLTAASAAKVAEGGLRFSVDKASVELMWLPVPLSVKEKGKAFVDTVVDRLGTGATGFIWLGLAALGLDRPETLPWVSVVVLAAVLGWLAVLAHARGAYIGALRDVLARRTLDTAGVLPRQMSAETRRTIHDTLNSDDPRTVGFGLLLLEELGGPLPNLERPLRHPDPTVRLACVELLSRRRDRAHRLQALERLSDSHPRVLEAALRYLRRTATAEDTAATAAGQLPDLDPVVVDVIRLGSPSTAQPAEHAIAAALAQGDPGRQQRILRLLGAAPTEPATRLLAPHITAPAADAPRVTRAALGAAGRAGTTALARPIADLLLRPALRTAAANALVCLDGAATGELQRLARDQQLATAVRLRAVQLLGASGRVEVAPTLLLLLECNDADVAHRALRALNRLRSRAGLELDAEQLEQTATLMHRELDRVHTHLQQLGHVSWLELRQEYRADGLLQRALAEDVDLRLERIFRLLALRHRPRDIHAAYRGVRSPTDAVRASSVELLDNLLPTSSATRLLPLLEPAGGRQSPTGPERRGLPPDSGQPRRLADLLQQQRCGTALPLVAAWSAGEQRHEALRPQLTELARSRNRSLATEASRAIEKLDAPGWKEPVMGLTTIEKALKLQKADVLQQASTDDLAHIAQIATEEQFASGEPVYSAGDTPDALFVVISGVIRLHRGEAEIALLREGETFGGWALVDESPRVASATALQETTLLRVAREDFQELLADRVDIVQAVFKAMVERLRTLADLANNP